MKKVLRRIFYKVLLGTGYIIGGVIDAAYQYRRGANVDKARKTLFYNCIYYHNPTEVNYGR